MEEDVRVEGVRVSASSKGAAAGEVFFFEVQWPHTGGASTSSTEGTVSVELCLFGFLFSLAVLDLGVSLRP